MNPADLTALDLLDAYRRGQLSPVEATRAVLDRVLRLDPVVNAFCLLDVDAALASARASQERWRRGEPVGRLYGVPVSIKDILLTDGWPTLRGSTTVDPAGPWTVDGPHVARVREHGAVLFGKTTTPELGWKGVGCRTTRRAHSARWPTSARWQAQPPTRHCCSMWSPASTAATRGHWPPPLPPPRWTTSGRWPSATTSGR